MSTSSARPDDLRKFADGVAPLDGELTDRQRRLSAAHTDFVSGLGWGRFDATGAVRALDDFVRSNERQGQQVGLIGALFERAGGRSSVKKLDNSVIQEYLDATRLGGPRQHVTYDEPTAYGFPPTSGYTNDPVNAASGNFVHAETDLEAGGLVLRRVYNSRSTAGGGHGTGWSSWATTRLRARDDGAHYAGPDGQRVVFGRQGPGYGRATGIDALVEPTDTGLELRWFDGRTWAFDQSGRLVTTAAGPGTLITLSYDDAGRLARLTDENGRSIELAWSGERIAAAALSTGRTVAYRYDGADRLVGAGAVRYEVDDDDRVSAIVDADGVAEVVNTYDDDGRVLTQKTPFGREVRIAYLPGGVTVVTDEADGPANAFVHDSHGRLLSVIDGHGARLSRAYDQWGNPVSVTDRNGAVTTMEWDDRSRLIAATRPGGVTLRYRYDDRDRLVEAAAGATIVVRYEYSGAERQPSLVVNPDGGVTSAEVEGGRVRRVTDPDGVTLSFGYDQHGDLVSVTDAAGATTTLERDEAGRVTATVTPLGRRSEFAYDGADRLTGWSDPVGAGWQFAYTAAGRLSTVSDPLGARRNLTYGPHGGLETTTDALGHSTGRYYDLMGNVVRRTEPDGAKWDFGYDALCRLTSTTDPAGATWLREYDAVGDVVATVDPVGVRRTMSRDEAGRVVARNDGLGTAAVEYDSLGRVIAVRRADGSELLTTYDRCGRTVSVTDGTGAVTRAEYTLGGRVSKVISPEGRVTTFTYDTCGRPASRADNAGRTVEYRYDADGAVIEAVQPDGLVATYAYDGAGRLAKAEVPGLGAVRYRWDKVGRPTEVTDSAYGTRRFRFDAAGRMIEAVDPLGHATAYQYDRRGWLVAVTDPLGGRSVRRLDEVGRLTAVTDPLGRTESMSYDPAGRLIERRDGSGRSTRWAYDAAGRTRAVAAGDVEITITRDALGRVVAVDEAGSVRHELSWDAADRLVARSRDGKVVRWRYTADGNRAAMACPDGAETTYRYDAAGLIERISQPGLGELRLRRDAAGRVVVAEGEGVRAAWRYVNGLLIGYDYSGAGTSSATLTRNEAGQITAATVDGATTVKSYDAAGQLVGDGDRAWEYDAGGRLVRDGDIRYTYDAAGQLLSAGDTAFEYDAAGRRVAERRAGGERRYAWDAFGRLSGVEDDGQRLTVVVDALGELAAVGRTDVVWDTASAPSAPLMIGASVLAGWGVPWASVTGGTADRLTPDWRGTPGGGRDAWGAPAASSPGIGFRGEVEFAGLVWLRDRVYDPRSRGFLSVDPLAAVPGSGWATNPYHFAGNDPFGRVDPLGQRPISDAELRRMRDNAWDRLGASIRGKVSDGLDSVSDTVGDAFGALKDLGGDVFDWFGDHWEYLLAIGVGAAGLVLMSTGVGSPLGAALLYTAGSGLFSAGVSIGVQEAVDGGVNRDKVFLDGAFGAAGGLAGRGAGVLVNRAASNAAGRFGTESAGRASAFFAGPAGDVRRRVVSYLADSTTEGVVNRTSELVQKDKRVDIGGGAEWQDLAKIANPMNIATDSLGVPGVKHRFGIGVAEHSSFWATFGDNTALKAVENAPKLGNHLVDEFATWTMSQSPLWTR
ncbi:DUF6531 domain-containing protein [Actinoplanes sp. TRM 88003]|uniref:DUF6531 domain-containing protein n=1 Tax=Paractinoplanes aksuensis TaxID=2939490 RepID=A0ABT1E6Q3_9ACTN|nr:DUF6531 domain-containing protein [Actinoplanes aksuensis]MCO8277496.1 DUF6531 domain-containing protein [Actinoplanes aksuensis]